ADSDWRRAAFRHFAGQCAHAAGARLATGAEQARSADAAARVGTRRVHRAGDRRLRRAFRRAAGGAGGRNVAGARSVRLHCSVLAVAAESTPKPTITSTMNTP